MSFVIAVPELLAAAAADVAGLGGGTSNDTTVSIQSDLSLDIWFSTRV